VLNNKWWQYHLIIKFYFSTERCNWLGPSNTITTETLLQGCQKKSEKTLRKYEDTEVKLLSIFAKQKFKDRNNFR
jgi:hypothetical protein